MLHTHIIQAETSRQRVLMRPDLSAARIDGP